MSLPKLIKITQALDVKQCSDLKKFVLYYVSTASDLYQILEAIIKHQSKMKDGDDVDEFSKKHFPNCKKKAFMNYLSQLYGYTENWIAHHQLQENEYQKDLLVQQWLNKNGLYDVSDLLVNRTLKKMDEDDKIDMMKHKYRAEMLFEHLFSYNPVKYKFDLGDYEVMVDSLAVYNAAMNYLFISELNSWGKISHKNTEWIKNKLDSFLSMAPENKLINVGKDLYKLLAEEDFESFLILKDFLLEDKFVIPSSLHHIIAANVIRHSSIFWTKGKHNDSKLTTDLAVYGMEKGVFFSNGKLISSTFHNVIFQLLIGNNYTYMISFLDKWIDKVSTQNREATYHLGLGQICFYFDMYEACIKHVWRNDFDDFNQKRLANDLYLVSTFSERNKDYESFHAAIQNSTLFYKRNKEKMSNHIYNGCMNLISFLKLLDKGNLPDKFNLESINPLPFRSWFQKIIMKK